MHRLVLLLVIVGFIIMPLEVPTGLVLMGSGIAVAVLDCAFDRLQRRRAARDFPRMIVATGMSPSELYAFLHGCQSPLHTAHLRARMEDPDNRFPIG